MADANYTVVADGAALLNTNDKNEAQIAYDKALDERAFTSALAFHKTIVIESAEVGVVQTKKRRAVNPDKKRKPKGKGKSVKADL